MMHRKIKNPKLKKAVLYIEKNYGRDISLSDIVEEAGVNHTTLTRLMKSEFNCTVMKYLTLRRISESEKLLAFSRIPIKDISDRVGFKTVQHFSKVFKKYTGKAPGQYRRKA